MTTILTVIHVLVSFALLGIILLQSGKGEGIGAGLGGASAAAQNVFGGGGTQSALAKGTVVLAAIFMSTSISLAYLSSVPKSDLDLDEGEGLQNTRRGEKIAEGTGPEPGSDESSSDSEQGSSMDAPSSDSPDSTDSTEGGTTNSPGSSGDNTGSSESPGAESGSSGDSMNNSGSNSNAPSGVDDSGESNSNSENSGGSQ